MKAISVMQPWAQLLVCGVKKYETRTWRTSHRGLLYIHAGIGLSDDMRERSVREPMRSLLKKQGISRVMELPRGALVGTVELTDCIDTDALADSLSDEQRALGDFRSRRWAWQMTNPRRLAEPILCAGNGGVFNVDPSLLFV